MTISAYVLPNGTVPVLKAIDDWAKRGEKLLRTAARHYSSLFRMRANGDRIPRTKFHPLDGSSLVEFKHLDSQTRILGFSDGKCMVVHYIVTGKKENKLDDGERTRAEALMCEYYERKKARNLRKMSNETTTATGRRGKGRKR